MSSKCIVKLTKSKLQMLAHLITVQYDELVDIVQ